MEDFSLALWIKPGETAEPDAEKADPNRRYRPAPDPRYNGDPDAVIGQHLWEVAYVFKWSPHAIGDLWWIDFVSFDPVRGDVDAG